MAKLPFKQTGIVTPITTSTTLAAPSALHADPTAGSLTITLPPSPQTNDIVRVYLDPSVSATKTVTIARNLNTIDGAASDIVFNNNINKQIDLVWNGSTWKTSTVRTGSSGGNVTISDTPPASANPGDFWFESDTFNLHVYYNDGTTSAWVRANAVDSSTASLRPYALYERNFQQSVGSGVNTEIQYNVNRGNTIAGITMLTNNCGLRNTTFSTLQLSLSAHVRIGFNIASGSLESWWSHRNAAGTEIGRVGWVLTNATPGNLSLNNDGVVLLGVGESIRHVVLQQSGAGAEMYASLPPRMMITELGRG